jgi:hypothetical protein
MMQAHPVPDMNARGCLAVESMTTGAIALLGADQRNNQIELRACIDNPSDAAKNSIHFSKCAKSIDVNRLQARGLREQFFVQHFENPRQWKVSKYDRETSTRRQKTEMQPPESFAAGTGIIPSGIRAHQTAVVLT